MTAVLVISTVILFIAIDLIRLRHERRQRAGRQQPVAAFSPLQYPRGVFLSDGHSWAALTDVGEVRVGADEMVGQALGRVDRIELPEVGTPIRRGECLARLRRKDRVLQLRAPISGTVVAINPAAAEGLGDALREDPYGTGWLARIWPVEHAEALSDLRVGDRGAAWLRAEIQRLVDFLSQRSTPDGAASVLADGAQPAIGALEHLDHSGLRAFAETFLRID